MNNPGLGPSDNPSLASGATPNQSRELEIVAALEGYRQEADQNRKGGLNPRDDKWRQNLDLYWGRHDFSRKANWQAREVMPEVSQYVDRFAAAMKEALVATPEGFYSILDHSDQEGDLSEAIKRMTDVWLSHSGRNQMGTLLAFPSVFEEQMKLGALTACSAVVIWKGDTENGRVAIESTDPRFVWLDHTYRNLYRVRRVELDRHDLYGMAKERDGKGNAIFNLPQLEQLIGSINSIEDNGQKEQMSGHGHQITTARQPIILDEYIATVLSPQGEVLADRALMVVANNKFLVRGPEANPFWHGDDWLTFTPLITTPLSVYGRSYMEDFGSVANTFNELTNMILDAVYTSSLKAWAMVPSMLANPEQIAEGISPNKIFQLEEGYKAADFATMLDLGTLPPESVKIWQAMKTELGEAAGINEIGLGQFAPKGRTSATEIMETKQSSSSLIRSLAQTVETRWLDPTLDLVWKTGLQHVSKNDPLMKMAAGEEMFGALISRRKELVHRPMTFQARGISSMIQRSATLKALMGILSIVSGSELLLAEFVKVVDMEKFVKKLFELSNVDITTLQLSERDKMIRSITQPLQQAGMGQGPPGSSQGGGAGAEMGSLARTMGIAR